MSVILLSLDHYKEVYKKACTYEFRRTVDINFCNALATNSKRLRAWLKSLYTMNVQSLHGPYDESDEACIEIGTNTIDGWIPLDMKGPTCDTYQMLKLLESIHYQIEESTIQEKGFPYDEDSVRLLEKAINELKTRIIADIPEYKQAKWNI